jgi:GrpB-like predicted nucleotidyltransferase (UPF0157 family)
MVQQLEIMPYDPQWVPEFQAERDRISTALGDLARRIDHNGSTSVPGLAAKPVIDIQVSLERIHPIDSFADRLGHGAERDMFALYAWHWNTGEAGAKRNHGHQAAASPGARWNPAHGELGEQAERTVFQGAEGRIIGDL